MICMKHKYIDKINSQFVLVNFLTLISCVISFTSIIFIFGGRINNHLFLFEYAGSCFITYLLFKNKLSKKELIYNFVFSTVLFYILCYIALLFYDGSWDGNVYHKQMIGLLKNGMNPLYNVNSGDIWAQHYSNGSEIWGAVLYSSFNDIEVGKVINLVLTVCLCIYSYSTIFKLSKSKLFSILFSIGISFNPILIGQFHTYYIDGIVGASLFIFILSIINFILNNFSASNKTDVAIFVMSSIITINLKFTALLLWGLFLLVLGCYILIINLKNKNYSEVRKFILIGLCTGIFSVGVVGSSTYMKNLVQHHNPFYPLMGAGSVDIETGNEPEIFKNYNHFEKWLYATFSETSRTYDVVPKLKVPFTVSSYELHSLEVADIRIGGLGVWYSGLLCLSLPLILIGIVSNFRKNKILNIVCLLLLGAILIPIPILPVVWQARYYPELYVIPFIAGIYGCYSNKKFMKFYSYVIICSAIINSLFIAPYVLEKLKNSIVINNQLVELAEKSLTEKIIISQDHYTFYGTYYNYIDKGIKYEYSKERLDDGISLHYGAMYKIVDSDGEE